MDAADSQVCMKGKVDLAPNDVYDLLTHPQNYKIFRGIEVRLSKPGLVRQCYLSSGLVPGPEASLNDPCHGMLGSFSAWGVNALTALLGFISDHSSMADSNATMQKLTTALPCFWSVHDFFQCL